MKKYKILAALKEDINSPSIWVKDKNISERTLAKICNTDGNKSVWAEIQVADDNYIKNYNSSKQRLNIKDNEDVLIVNQWYRSKLGL